LETFVQVDQTIQADLARKAEIEHVRRTHEEHLSRSAMEAEARRRHDSFELERRRAHSRGVAETIVHRVEPVGVQTYDHRYQSRSANAFVRQASPVREPVGSRIAWKRPD
jgi:hypothetical protein